MKILLTVLTLVVCVFAQSKVSTNRLVDTHYDQFNDRTTIMTAPITPRGNLMISASVVYPGKARPSINMVRLAFLGNASFWPNLENEQPVSILIDNKKPVTYQARYESTFQTEGIVSTVYSLALSMDEFAGIACSKNLNLKVAYNEIRLAPADASKLKAFLLAIDGKCPENGAHPAHQRSGIK